MTVKHVSFNEREEKSKRVKKHNNRRRDKFLRNLLNTKSFYNTIDYKQVEIIEDM